MLCMAERGRVLSGIILINRNGLRWCDAPKEYGPSKSLYNSWKRWSEMGGDERMTNKRRTPAPIPKHLTAHLRRWRDQGATWAVEYSGGAVNDIKRAFAKACLDAGLSGVRPHTLKHTAITWAIPAGFDIWDRQGSFRRQKRQSETSTGITPPITCAQPSRRLSAAGDRNTVKNPRICYA